MSWSKDNVKLQAKRLFEQGPSYASQEYYEYILTWALGGAGQSVKGFLEGNRYENFKLIKSEEEIITEEQKWKDLEMQFSEPNTSSNELKFSEDDLFIAFKTMHSPFVLSFKEWFEKYFEEEKALFEKNKV